MKKWLLIDKSVFQKTSTQKLQEFVKNHFLILPDTLYYECVTTNKDKEKLLDRFRVAILAGAYICPSVVDIIKREAKNLYPCGFLVDLAEASKVRETFQQNPRPYSLEHSQRMLKQEYDMAENILTSAGHFKNELVLKNPEILSEVRKWDSSKKARPTRFQKWVELVDDQDMHKAAIKSFGDITQNPDKYCLSDDWISWHYLRLWYVLHHEKGFLIQSGAKFPVEAIEHDLQDIKYVTLLMCVDAILTDDDGCLCLAKAAFPQKDVFSDITEVSDSYICHWS